MIQTAARWISKCLHQVFNALVLVSNGSPAFVWAFPVQNKTSLWFLSWALIILFFIIFLKMVFRLSLHNFFLFPFVLYVCIVLLSVVFLTFWFFFVVVVCLFEVYELCMFKCFILNISFCVEVCAHASRSK